MEFLKMAYRIYFFMELIGSLSLFDYTFFIDFLNSLDTQHFKKWGEDCR